MNILIDIGHPAHVHFFYSIYSILKEKHNFYFTCRNVEIIKHLLDYYKIHYYVLGNKGQGIFDKFKVQFRFTKELHNIIEENNIDIACGVSIVYSARGTKAKSIVFCDDDRSVIKFFSKFVLPYANCVLSPEALQYESNRNVIYYPGQHELSYLHPKRYVPNDSFMNYSNIRKGDIYFVLRFSAFTAHHDKNENGMDYKQKKTLIEFLEQYGKVFITSEKQLPSEFEEYSVPVEPQDIHNMMYYATMTISDSQTMSSESAILGTPSFRCNSFSGRLSVLEELEKVYSLTFSYPINLFDLMIKRIKYELELGDIKKRQRVLLDRYYQDKIDVAAFWAWFIENYPDSQRIVRSSKFTFDEFM